MLLYQSGTSLVIDVVESVGALTVIERAPGAGGVAEERPAIAERAGSAANASVHQGAARALGG